MYFTKKINKTLENESLCRVWSRILVGGKTENFGRTDLSSAHSSRGAEWIFCCSENQLERYKQRPLVIPRLAPSFSPAFHPLPFHFRSVSSSSFTPHLSLYSFPLPSFLPPSLYLAPTLLSAVLQISSIIPCIIPSPKGRVSPIVILTVRLNLVAPSLN